MGADDDVDLACEDSLEHVPLLLERREPGERPDREGKLGEPRLEAAAVLLGEHGRRHEHRHLVARLDRLEGGPHRHLRLAEADVAAEEPVHRPGLLHVVADRLGRGELVGRLVERKRLLELPLPGRRRREGDARAARAGRLEADHVARHVGHGVADGLLLLFPGLAAELGELRGELRAADVLLHELDAGGGHEDLRRLGELDLEELLRASLLLEQLEPLVAADAVADVDDVIAVVQVEERVDRPREPPPRRPRRRGVLAAEELPGADDRELLGHEPKSPRDVAVGEMEPARSRGGRVAKQFREPVDLRVGRADDPDLLVAAHRLELLPHPVEHAREPLHALDRELRRGLEARRRDAGERDRRRAVDPREDVVGLRGVLDDTANPLERAAGLLGEFERLHERPPGAGGQDVGKLRPPHGRLSARRSRPALPRCGDGGVFGPRPGAGRERREVDRLERRDAPLAGDVECAERLDLVAEELHPHGPIPVDREEVHDAAASGKCSRLLDRVGRVPAAGDEPVGEFGGVEPSADMERTGALLDLPRVGERCEQRLDARHQDPGRRLAGPRERLDDREPLRHGGLVDRVIVAERLDRRQDGHGGPAEDGQVAGEGVAVGSVRQHDDE